MNYSVYANTAKEKISQYGGDLSITRKNKGSYNKETHQYEYEEEIINGKGLLSYYNSDFINGTTVQNGDVKFMCYFINGKPKAGDIINFGDKVYNIITVKELNLDGTEVIYYTIQARS